MFGPEKGLTARWLCRGSRKVCFTNNSKNNWKQEQWNGLSKFGLIRAMKHGDKMRMTTILVAVVKAISWRCPVKKHWKKTVKKKILVMPGGIRNRGQNTWINFMNLKSFKLCIKLFLTKFLDKNQKWINHHSWSEQRNILKNEHWKQNATRKTVRLTQKTFAG